MDDGPPPPTPTDAAAPSTAPTGGRVPPELLAPAGDWECVAAAIENGADAVYFGLDAGFNARARAANFPPADLPRLMHTLHRRGVKGYATLNTLVFSDELAEFERVVVAVAEAGVDAVLLQDIGAALLVREVCPDLPMHASTQMTLTSAECIALAETLGMCRVVAAREVSIDEIRAIRRRTSMPLEVFVHGALCVAYSGQCLTSESLGGRSANRGQCAQACRLPYDLVCDGKDVDLGDRRYLLSPQDLAAYELVPQLIAAGVASFKIEGRLKAPEYVAAITRHYRAAIDAAVAARPVEFTRRDVEEMELTFSRGFSPGWLGGCDHKMLVPATSSAKRGVRLGTVAAVRGERVTVDLVTGVKRGDGVAFDCGTAAAADGGGQRGGRVYEVFQRGRSVTNEVAAGPVELSFGRGVIDLSAVRPGQSVWKTDDPQVTARLRRSFAAADPLRRRPVDLRVTVVVGEPVRVTAGTADGAVRCEVATVDPAREAVRHALDAAVLRDQLGRLGGTPWELGELTATIVGKPMVPFSVLGRLRHDLVAALEAAATAASPRRIRPVGTGLVPLHRDAVGTDVAQRGLEHEGAASPRLHVLVRSLDQLRDVLDLGERLIYADFADIRRYGDAVAACRAAAATIHLATPRIQKPDEMGIFRVLARQRPDGVLVRNFSGLRFFRDQAVPVVGDFSLNVANERTAGFLLGEGLARVTASYDLNRDQLLALVAATPPEWLEVVIHQHMPMFHMEHCVFCAVLSPGTNKTNCGRPCDDHVVRLRDRIGVEHPLTADVGCRNTLFNAVPQSAAEAVPQLAARGVGHFRVELLDERGDVARDVIVAYRDLLAGRTTGREVWGRLKAANRVGVTRGTLEHRRDPLAIL
jgi:putative protease